MAQSHDADLQRKVSDDRRMDEIIGNILRIGVLVSAALVLIAGVLYLLRYGGDRVGYRVFHGEPADLRSVPGIAGTAFHGGRRALIQFGLLLLIATPVSRVAFSVFAFARQRDWLYVAVTLAVFALLLYGLVFGA